MYPKVLWWPLPRTPTTSISPSEPSSPPKPAPAAPLIWRFALAANAPPTAPRAPLRRSRRRPNPRQLLSNSSRSPLQLPPATPICNPPPKTPSPSPHSSAATNPQFSSPPPSPQTSTPDHPALARLTRDAARLARYAGIPELHDLPPHSIRSLLFYAITPDAEPYDTQPILIDISPPELIDTWTRAMQAHASQNLRTSLLQHRKLWRLR